MPNRIVFWIGPVAVCLAAAAQAAGGGRYYYVAPAGRPDGNGSRQRPLDLATALSRRSPARPGDTIYLLGGTYTGGFVSELRGARGAPILVRQYPGQRATIDCRANADGGATFTVRGQWTTFWGLEVTCSEERRETKTAGSHPPDISRGGIDCRGDYIRFINMVVHDCGVGFGLWSSGAGGEVYGCIIYNNGWQGPDRGHGHGIYAQNRTDTKRLVDNIIFNQFSHGIHVYGSARASLKGFHIEGNVCFNNGSPSRAGAAPDILVGGGCPASGIKLLNNFTYRRGLGRTSVRLGYKAVNGDLVACGNYFVGCVSLKNWRKLDVSGNTFISAGPLVALEASDGLSVANYAWDENTYRAVGRHAQSRRFLVRLAGRGGALGFDAWRAETGFDRAGKSAAGRPGRIDAFIRPNRYQLGRAHIVVYNWTRAEAVEVDLRDFLKVGARYEVLAAVDYFGRPVVAGTYDGRPVRLPLRPVQPVRPVGGGARELRPVGPTFSVFVLRGAR
ncbi:MAG: hypothetical protein B1H04_06085 [Planctomycetales bacterium 4484_123]|nr:MAG: hypothetical protein B1H04_06085 [Planctomycetales bacterium 4484_123]